MANRKRRTTITGLLTAAVAATMSGALLAAGPTATAQPANHGAVVPTPSAKRAAPVVDIISLKSSGWAIASGSCRYVSVTAKTRIGDTRAGYAVSYISASIEIWKGGHYIGDFDVDGDATYGADLRTLTGTYMYCPSEGLGKLRLGPTQIEWVDTEYYESGTITDATRGTMDIRQATKSTLTGNKFRGNLTVVAAPKYFATNYVDRWTRFPDGDRVTLQRSKSGKAGTFHTIGRSKIQDGRVFWNLKVKQKAYYRVVDTGTKRTRPLVSRAHRY